MRHWLGWMWMLGLAGLGALGLLWLADQRHGWERPQWEPRRFVPVLTSGGADTRPPRVIAVQPGCPACLAGLEHAAARRPLLDARRMVALIVDWPRRPDTSFAQRLGVDEVWWDAHGVWRRRWGRRVYGEFYDFDRRGGLTGSGHVLRPGDDHAAPGGR